MQHLAKFTTNEIADLRGRAQAFEAKRARKKKIVQDDEPQVSQSSKDKLFVLLIGLCGAIVLIAGLALIWRLVPNSPPAFSERSAADYQSTYIVWVADNYWQKRNLAQAQQQLAGWNMQDLASYMPILIQETNNAETRKHLVALRDALKLPVPQADYPPAQWTDDYKKLYIIHVASRYWLSGDKTVAQQSFADWNQDELANQLVVLQRQATDSETRRNLVVLTDVLRLPITQSSILLFIMNQPGVMIGVLLAAVPMLALTTTVSLPRIRKIRRSVIKRMGVATPTMLERFAKEEAAEKAEADRQAGVIAKPLEDSLDEILAQAQTEEDIIIGAAPGEPGAEKTEEEKKAEEQKKAEEEEEKEKAESGGLGDLASLFEEEDTSINALEAFVKGMADVNVDALLTMAQGVVAQMRNGKRKD